MKNIEKIGLLVLSDDQQKFLVCEPGEGYQDKRVTQYLMPGGHFDEDSVKECLKNEIKEELDTDVDLRSVKKIGSYSDIAASDPNITVTIHLYSGKLLGIPRPSSEIGRLHWIGKKDKTNNKVSPIIRNKIIPDLEKQNILN